MPTYDYRCEKCQGTFELFQSMKDSALEVCPKEKFYVTDYRSPSYQESAKKESSAKEGSGAKTEGGGAKTDSGAAKSGGGSGSTGGGTGSSSNKPAN